MCVIAAVSSIKSFALTESRFGAARKTCGVLIAGAFTLTYWSICEKKNLDITPKFHLI